MPIANFEPAPLSGPPAAVGGRPAFPEGLPLARPSVPNVDAVADRIRDILAGGVLTNGSHVRELERRAEEYLDVTHCIAVSSCTAGLMLVLRAAELSGDVIVPSFTFAATAHAVSWNGLRPVFADINPDTLTLSATRSLRATGVRTSAILATHTYGTPCNVEMLQEVARTNGLRLFFDAAHAFGSLHGDKHVGGFGDAEVFSLSPTKVLVAAEGGIIATNDDVLAERCRMGRDYGNPGDYDCRFVGLNARMSELHAATALASLEGLEDRIRRRNDVAAWYQSALSEIQGIRFPLVPEEDRSTFKDFTVLIDPEEFGLDAGSLQRALGAEGVDTRRYFSPPVHRMRAYRGIADTNGDLPVTDSVSARVLSLPMFDQLQEWEVVRVAEAIQRVRATLAGTDEGGTLPAGVRA
jgi:dTDP-4-amino-4,6-dideoxygalactose transaminase